MPFTRLRKFHERTMETYRQDHDGRMEDWKRKVMDIHEQSIFLFYLDDCLEENRDERTLLIRGELVKGSPPLGTRLYLYTGQGQCRGRALLRSQPQEKESERKGLFKRRRNEMIIQLEDYLQKRAESMDNLEISRCSNNILLDISLISDLMI